METVGAAKETSKTLEEVCRRKISILRPVLETPRAVSCKKERQKEYVVCRTERQLVSASFAYI